MEGSISPQSPMQTSVVVTVTLPNDTATAPPTPPDCCLEQANALRGALTDLKKALQTVQVREESWYRCKHGLSLSSTEQISGPAFSDATTLRGATGAIFIQIERLALATGIRIE